MPFSNGHKVKRCTWVIYLGPRPPLTCGYWLVTQPQCPHPGHRRDSCSREGLEEWRGTSLSLLSPTYSQPGAPSGFREPKSPQASLLPLGLMQESIHARVLAGKNDLCLMSARTPLHQGRHLLLWLEKQGLGLQEQFHDGSGA